MSRLAYQWRRSQPARNECWRGWRPWAGRRWVDRAKAGPSSPPSSGRVGDGQPAVPADGRHSRRRAGLRRGGSDLVATAGRRGGGRLPVGGPGAEPRRARGGSEDSAREVDLNRNFPARNLRPNIPRLPPRGGGAERARDRVFRGVGRIAPAPGGGSVHAPFACINDDGPAEAWAEAVAAASGWAAQADLGYPTPGSLGSWAGGGSGSAGTDDRATSRGVCGVSRAGPGRWPRPWKGPARVNARRRRVGGPRRLGRPQYDQL